ncbi:MAG: cytochrome c maturation protein CcmE [Acidobacteriota bacterium]
MGIRRRQVAVAVGIVLVAVIYVIITGMQDTMVYYYTVSEVRGQEAALTGEPLRVAGKVVVGSIERSTGNLVHSFMIEEGGQQLPVVYRGIAPDTFQDQAEAVVEGRLDAAGVFQATFLMAKCPSKYEAATDYSKYREAGVAAPAQGR